MGRGRPLPLTRRKEESVCVCVFVGSAEAWNETEVPINISIVTEAINASEDLLEDDNESTELDGNLSAAKLVSVSLRTDCYPKGWSSRAAAEQWLEACRRYPGGTLIKMCCINASSGGPKRTCRRCRTTAAWLLQDVV